MKTKLTRKDVWCISKISGMCFSPKMSKNNMLSYADYMNEKDERIKIFYDNLIKFEEAADCKKRKINKQFEIKMYNVVNGKYVDYRFNSYKEIDSIENEN